MSANPNVDGLYMTKAEYLDFLQDSEVKYEYINGEAIAMAGAKPNHNRIVMALSILVGGHVMSRDCEAFGSDQLVEIEKLDNCFFPDLSVVCGEPHFTDDSLPAILNPMLIVEVLSPSTASFDRDEKFHMYRQIDSFREYVLVWQDKAKVARYYLNDQNIWEFSDALGLESSITFKSIDCTLALTDIYANVVFENETLDENST